MKVTVSVVRDSQWHTAFEDEPFDFECVRVSYCASTDPNDFVIKVEGIDGKSFDEYDREYTFDTCRVREHFTIDIVSRKRGIVEIYDDIGREIER